MSDRLPALTETLALHFEALRLATLRIEDALATESERNNAYTSTCARKLSPRSSMLYADGASTQPTPSPLCGLA